VTAGSLGLRELNRATLERQLLLRRAERSAADAIGHLGGLQAQAPLAPYLGLWTRLSGFRPDHLKDLLTKRSVVRAHLMRNTVHLLTAEDFVSFRPLVQPLMERGLAGAFGKNLDGVDLSELTAIAAALLGETALTRAQLARRLAPRWPDRDPASLAHAATHLLPLVQAPPRGLWGSAGQATFVLAAAWLDGPLTPPDPARAVEQLVLRYLAAYGPASVADIQAWSGLSRLREVTERLGARLRVFTGPGGQLLDLPDAPRPGPDVPAPPRFLPAYDNLLLSFADRSRVIPHRRPVPLPPGHGASRGTLLVDGLWQADWTIVQAVLQIEPFVPLRAGDQDAIAAEGERLLDFAVPPGQESARDVRFARPGRVNKPPPSRSKPVRDLR
jgi:Winged helix DNA-binding domain